MIQTANPLVAKLIAERVLGGPGSGNFGHAGRPGQVGGSASGLTPGWENLDPDRKDFAERVRDEVRRRLDGESYEDYHRIQDQVRLRGEAIVYHGTADTAIDSIEKEGLKPGGGRGGDVWAQEQGDFFLGMNSDTPAIANSVIAGRKASVFFTTREHFATKFAELASDVNDGSMPQILRIKIPKSALDRVKLDELSDAVRFEGTIPPEWIELLNPVTEKYESIIQTPKLKAAAEDDGSLVLYAVILCWEKEPVTLAGYTLPLAPEHAARVLDKALRALGGPGSGNFGHAGRPGEVGGSAPNTGGWPIDADTPRALGQNYPRVITEHYKQWAEDLSEPQRQAIINFTSTSAQTNELLRRKPDASIPAIKNIKDALAKAPTPPPPQLVWRGLHQKAIDLQSLAAGDTIKLNGFQSTSINPYVALEFGTTILEIHPSAGGYIEPISHFSYDWEYMLPHGAEYVVRGLNMVKFKDRQEPVPVLQLEMKPVGTK